MSTRIEATVDDLYRVPENGKAEIVNGKAEVKMALKRADYFAAGTLVVWDVDVLREKVVQVYRSNDPQNPTVYHVGEIAEAEPAMPGWTMAVNEIFE